MVPVSTSSRSRASMPLPIPRSARTRPDRTSSLTGTDAPRIVSAARRYARTVYGLASRSSSSDANASRRSAIWAFPTAPVSSLAHSNGAARLRRRRADHGPRPLRRRDEVGVDRRDRLRVRRGRTGRLPLPGRAPDARHRQARLSSSDKPGARPGTTQGRWTTGRASVVDMATGAVSETLTYDVFINEAPPQEGVLPNGEPKRFSPQASTLLCGSEDAVLTDPPMTTDQARVLGDWIAAKGRNVTDIFITHGHGDHWFAAGPLVERFGARVVASAGTIAQMRASVATRPLLWDKVYAGMIPPTPVTAVTVPDDRFAIEGHELVIVDVGATDSDDTTVLHVPDLDLVVAGDVIYNGVHMYLAQAAIVGGFGPWRAAIDKVEALEPRHIVCGHQRKERDDDAQRTIAETRKYLDDAEELLQTQDTASTSSTPRSSATRTISEGPSCGRARALSTAPAKTPTRTSASSFSTPGCEEPCAAAGRSLR